MKSDSVNSKGTREPEESAGAISRREALGALVVTGAAVGLGGYFAYRATKQSPSPRTLLVHCGTSMRPPMEQLAQEFEQRTGTTIEFNFGGNEVLFPQIKTRKEGDLFICHDPFRDNLQSEGLVSKAVTVGYLDPVLIVAKDNPRQIRMLSDLFTKKDLRVGSTDPRYATCGKMVEELAAKRDWTKSFDECQNMVFQTRSHADVATALTAGQLDAGVVWNFVAVSFKDKIDSVPTGEKFPETRVSVASLACSKNRADANKFLQFAGSDYGRGVFASHGYVLG